MCDLNIEYRLDYSLTSGGTGSCNDNETVVIRAKMSSLYIVFKMGI